MLVTVSLYEGVCCIFALKLHMKMYSHVDHLLAGFKLIQPTLAIHAQQTCLKALWVDSLKLTAGSVKRPMLHSLVSCHACQLLRLMSRLPVVCTSTEVVLLSCANHMLHHG